ncbi:MAG: hypothetical protein OHK006_12920 [Thermodesulfovibrionales bacterium]
MDRESILARADLQLLISRHGKHAVARELMYILRRDALADAARSLLRPECGLLMHKATNVTLTEGDMN